MALSFKIENIDCDAAFAMAKTAIAHGRKIGAKMVIAIVDNGGHLVALCRDNGAFAASVDIAKDKAITSAIFGMSTDELHNALKANPVLLDGIARRPNTIMFGGGYPIKLNGQIFGGIGASGGSEDQDRECALCALESLKIQAN